MVQLPFRRTPYHPNIQLFRPSIHLQWRYRSHNCTVFLIMFRFRMHSTRLLWRRLLWKWMRRLQILFQHNHHPRSFLRMSRNWIPLPHWWHHRYPSSPSQWMLFIYVSRMLCQRVRRWTDPRTILWIQNQWLYCWFLLLRLPWCQPMWSRLARAVYD